MTRGFFITGTDTGVGKTVATVVIMNTLKQSGYKVAGMKPVASGCSNTDNGLRNDDAQQIQQAASENNPYEWINPYAFVDPIAPHIAAQRESVKIDPEKIIAAYHKLSNQNQVIIVEGAGGWRVPYADNLLTSDLVKRLKLDVILVVGIRLGCINHAILTAESVEQDGLRLTGWIANELCDNYPESEEIIETLNLHISPPMLGHLPWMPGKKVQQSYIKHELIFR